MMVGQREERAVWAGEMVGGAYVLACTDPLARVSKVAEAVTGASCCGQDFI